VERAQKIIKDYEFVDWAKIFSLPKHFLGATKQYQEETDINVAGYHLGQTSI